VIWEVIALCARGKCLRDLNELFSYERGNCGDFNCDLVKRIEWIFIFVKSFLRRLIGFSTIHLQFLQDNILNFLLQCISLEGDASLKALTSRNWKSGFEFWQK